MPLYSDINKRDPQQRSRVEDLDAVVASLENALSIGKKQALFNPDGIDFDNVLFELNEDEAEFMVKNLLHEALGRENRVQLVWGSTIVTQDPTNHALRVKAVFEIKGLTNDRFEKNLTIQRPQ